MATTTEDARTAAARLLKGDWDANGTASIHLPANLALKLLEDRGWRQDGGRWYTPNGDTYYWDRAEALTVELVAEAAGAPGAAETKLRFPGYRIVTFHNGNTDSYPVPADRVVAGLSSRIGKMTGDAGTEDEVIAAAEHVLAVVDAGHNAEGEPARIADDAYPVEHRDREAFLDLDGGTVWVQPLDPSNDQHRDILRAVGVESFNWPV